VRIVSTSQYKVPAKYAMPLTRPSRIGVLRMRRARGLDGSGVPSVATATISGASAIQPNAGWPNFGKLSASRTPDASASA
jgi:hypothetical protein